MNDLPDFFSFILLYCQHIIIKVNWTSNLIFAARLSLCFNYFKLT